MPITNWVITDLANKEGRALVKAALQEMVRKRVYNYTSEHLSNTCKARFFTLHFNVSGILIFNFSV